MRLLDIRGRLVLIISESFISVFFIGRLVVLLMFAFIISAILLLCMPVVRTESTRRNVIFSPQNVLAAARNWMKRVSASLRDFMRNKVI